MAVKIWYEASDGTKFATLEAACDYEYKKTTVTFNSFKPPIFIDDKGKQSNEYGDTSLACIFYSPEDAKKWRQKAEEEGNDFNPNFPQEEEMGDWINDDGYFAAYWNEWLEEWEWYCWPEITDNYRKAQQLHEILKTEGFEK